MIRLLALFLTFFTLQLTVETNGLYAQMVEICDNGIDDDGDGLIDINDDDCDCPIDLPTSLIPNPSFEDQTDCPNNENQLELAIPWRQASRASTDYMHTCGGFLQHPLVGGQVPLPMPDGGGCVGFRNGKPSKPNFKESTGTRLLEPMEDGTLYTLNMWVGFLSASTSPEFELFIYGAFSTNQNDGILPYGGTNDEIGCPMNVEGYEILGSTIVSGQNEWVNTNIEFRPSRNLNVIVIGANCEENPFNHYYYFDNLILQKTVEFGEQPSVTGHPCMNNVSLDLPSIEVGDTYQWYKDGVAINGETNQDYIIPTEQEDIASYQIMVTSLDGECKLSAPYTFEIPEITTTRFVSICDNEPIQLNEQDVLEEGVYSELFITEQNCDSTVITNLTILPTYDIFLSETICMREEYILGTQTLNTNGVFTEFFTTINGCDSVVTVDLEVLNSIVKVDAQGDKVIQLGESTPIKAEVSDFSKVSFYSWTSSDSLTTICDTCLYQVVFPTETTTYTFKAFDTAGCDVSDNVVIEVEQYYETYFPGAFSPNGDGINDIYYINGTTNIARVLSLDLYDRWGNQVFQNNNFPVSNELFGWDGTLKNVPANPGVYVYMAKIEFVDGHIENFKGDLVLLR